MIVVALAGYEFDLGLVQPIFVISRCHCSLPKIISTHYAPYLLS